MPAPSVHDLILTLDIYLPRWLGLRRALYTLATASVVVPLLLRHRLQRRLPRQHLQTAWLSTAFSIISDSFLPETLPLSAHNWDDQEPHPSVRAQNRILSDLENIAENLGWNNDEGRGLLDLGSTKPPPILLTKRTHCRFCPGDVFLFRESDAMVTVIDADYQRKMGYLVVAHCTSCSAKYFPDIITKAGALGGRRIQKLEEDPEWIRISKRGVWAHRNIALLQRHSLVEFRGTWQRFRLFFNKTHGHGEDILTERQTHRLFIEYFIRTLLSAQGRLDDFECPSFSNPSVVVKAALAILGEGGGVIPGAMEHHCADCLHEKRYREDLDGAALGAEHQVADVDDDGENLVSPILIMEFPVVDHCTSAKST